MSRTFQPYTAVAGVLPVCNHSTSSGGTCTLSLYTASAGDQSLSQLCATADGNCDWYDLDTARCNLILSACHTSTHRHHSDRAGLSWVHLIRGLYSPDCTLHTAVNHEIILEWRIVTCCMPLEFMETLSFQYSNRARDCSVQCGIGTRNTY